MHYMTNREYEHYLRKIKDANKQKELKHNLREEKRKYSPRLRIETSKLIAIYLFVLLNAIVIYAMSAMWTFADLSYLGILISDIAAQVLIYAIYCLKAYKSKKSEEDMRFMREKHYNELSDFLSAGADSQEYVPVNGNVETFSCGDNAVG